MATLTGLIPVTVGTFEAYHGGVGGDTIGGGGRGGGWERRAQDHIWVILGLYWGYMGVILGLYWGYIGLILGLCWGYVAVRLGLYCLDFCLDLHSQQHDRPIKMQPNGRV